MRTINHYSEQPAEREFRPIGNGKKGWCYIRQNIKKETVSGEEGPRTEWTAVEYASQVTALAVKDGISDALAEAIVADTDDAEAARVRGIRNLALLTSDHEVLPDRHDTKAKGYDAWAEYRRALRDLPEQKGFPWDVTWPKKPEEGTRK